MKAKKLVPAVVLFVCVFAGVGLLYFFRAFEFLEYKAYDLRVNVFAPATKPSDDIVLVLLNQNSIDWASENRGWGWPWPRAAYAEIIDYFHQGSASSIAFDVLFTEPSVYRAANQDEIIDNAVSKMEEMRETVSDSGDAQTSRRGASAQRMGDIEGYREAMNALRGLSAHADDDSFAAAERASGRVVQAAFFSTQSGSTQNWPDGLDKPLFIPENFGGFLDEFKIAQEGFIGGQFPIGELAQAAAAVGNVTNREDPDGVNRRLRLFTLFDGKAVPGLSAASLLISGSGRNIAYNEKKRQIEWGQYIIPVDKNGCSLVRFRGSLDRYIPYFAIDILQSSEALAAGEEPLLYPDEFEGKHIFFGYYAPGLFDICTSPFSAAYPGMGMHVTMLDNILSGDFIREAPAWVPWAMLAAIVLFITVLAVFSGKLPVSLSGTVVIMAAIVAGAFAAYYCGLWLPMVMPLAGALGAFVACYIYNYATEGSQKRYIKSAFSRYVSPYYVDKLVAQPELLNLGGTRIELSMFFSDIQGFTTISENLDPDQLKELLNDYLTLLTDIIQNSGGTIDKYEGDAIIAFWNAPVPLEDHSSRALSAALACQKALAEKGPYFEEKFRAWNIDNPKINKRLPTRIGLNTGYAVVGNFGSQKQFNYTMLGDAVNLAARLEGLNKQFGTYLMCTDNTFTEAKKRGAFFGRQLAKVAVVGKSEPVTVWEPMFEDVFKAKEEVIREFDQARDIFYQGDFKKALPLFEALKEKDRPPAFYADQCRYYLEKPEAWKGFWEALSK